MITEPKCPFDGRKEQVKFSGINYSVNSLFRSDPPFAIFLDLFSRIFKRYMKLHSAGEQLIDA